MRASFGAARLSVVVLICGLLHNDAMTSARCLLYNNQRWCLCRSAVSTSTSLFWLVLMLVRYRNIPDPCVFEHIRWSSEAEFYIFTFLLNLLVCVCSEAQMNVFRLSVIEAASQYGRYQIGPSTISLDPDQHLVMFFREFQKLGRDSNKILNLFRDLDVWVSRLGSCSGSLSACMPFPV